MDINFRETYKSLSTAELLNIVKQTNDYQPEAVLAAIALLKERNITREDHMEAEQMESVSPRGWMGEQKYLKAVSSKIEDLVEPIVSLETQVNTQKWINILIITLGIYSVWVIVVLILSWRRMSEIHHFQYFYLTDLIEPLYLMVTIGGLYKRKKWGWRLFMIYCILRTLSFGYGIFLVSKYSFLRRYFVGEIAWTLTGIAAVYLLCRKQTRTHFNINEYYLRNTVFVAIILFLLLQVFYEYFP